MFLLRSAVVLAVSSLAFPISAQDSPRRDPQAVTLLERSMAAMGGSALAGVSDTRAEIMVRSLSSETAEETPAVLKTLGGAAWRLERTGAKTGAATVANGDWISSRSAEGEIQEYPAIAVAEAGNWRIPWLSIIAEVNESGMEVTYVGTEGEGKLHRIRLMRNVKGTPLEEVADPCDVLLDAQTGLPVKLTFFAHPPENLLVSIPVEVEYAEYKAFSGVLIPTKIKYSIRGHLLTEITVNQFTVNAGASPAEFEVR